MQFHELECSSFLCLSSSQEFGSACCLRNEDSFLKPFSELFTYVVDGQYLTEYEMNFGALSTFAIKS